MTSAGLGKEHSFVFLTNYNSNFVALMLNRIQLCTKLRLFE